MDKKGPDLSVVVPLLNEQDNIRELYEQITQALTGKYAYEIIVIDDGSTDASLDILRQLQQDDPRLRIICFRKNFGQTSALSAGFAYARGGIIVALDADLQNDPADIPRMVAKLEKGYDVVSGWRKNRKDRTLSRLLPSKIANWL
ncbi:MAG: glycosyltransferase family 2 protein, partial [Planctomycetota bacterium]